MPEHMVKGFVNNGPAFLVFIFLAVWGGTASYLSRLKKQNRKFSIFELIGEWTISGFAGIITAYFCQEFALSFFMTAAFSGIAGHMGGRAIFIIENVVKHRAEKIMDIEISENDQNDHMG